MQAEQATYEKGYIVRAREIFIRVSLLAIMVFTCFLILRPFVLLIGWGAIIAIAIHPAYRWLARKLGGKEKLAATLCTSLLLLMLIVPAFFLAGTLVEGAQSLSRQLKAGKLDLPPAPSALSQVPVVGKQITYFWSLASTNLEEVVKRFGPQIQEKVPALLSAGAAVGIALLQFVLSILLSGFLLANASAAARFSHLAFARVFGDQGPEFEELTVGTIRTVTNGILGVSALQTACASVGFVLVGLPGAGLWSLIFLVAGIVQMGGLLLIPAVLYVIATQSPTRAGIFLIWCVVVGLMDNILKPILMSRGSKVPIAAIFLGVLGGFVAMGIIGLFAGAIILSVAYKLTLAWLEADRLADSASA